MIFNSIEFAIFLPIVFFIYWLINHEARQLKNIVLLGASYLFYGWWDWRFLFLIIFSSLVDYIVGLQLEQAQLKSRRKLLLFISLFVNLGLLAVFKYFNFFADSLQDAFTFFGQSLDVGRLDIILPVGISFYTFQTLSYSIDVYRKKLKPTSNIISFFTYVAFFPQLVAGPIERASNLLPQFAIRKRFNYASSVDGLRQILWGLFKKVVIADNCAEYVNTIFSGYADYNGSTLLLGAVLFSFQIYGDFSGYSDIAIGTARLFGFDLKKNFNFPYFSKSVAEFWRKWHISLSSWFRDYLYFPIGGSRGNLAQQIRNVLVIFVVSGFWHGANWTFIFWGLLNALYFIPQLLLKTNRNHLNQDAPGKNKLSLKGFVYIIGTFLLTSLTWVFFRAPSIFVAFDYIGSIFSNGLFTIPQIISLNFVLLSGLLFFFVVWEWLNRFSEHALAFSQFKMSVAFRWVIYVFLISCIIWLHGGNHSFIYFQF